MCSTHHAGRPRTPPCDPTMSTPGHRLTCPSSKFVAPFLNSGNSGTGAGSLIPGIPRFEIFFSRDQSRDLITQSINVIIVINNLPSYGRTVPYDFVHVTKIENCDEIAILLKSMSFLEFDVRDIKYNYE